MKRLVTLLLLLIASLFAKADKLDGNWRGMLELGQGAKLVLGIEISTIDGQDIVYLDSPNQGMVDHPVENLELSQDEIRFDTPELNASFDGTITGNQIVGVFTQGKSFDITLTKLSDKSTARLENEVRWYGDLNVTRQATLPLVLNIAVIESGYYATLDSPQQQSFGIPLSDFSIDESKLSFTSPIINASYSAKKVDEMWEGTFVQGAAMPLNLKKKPL